MVDRNGLPLAVSTAPANTHDSKLYLPTMSDFKIKIATGRPITRPKMVIGDASYDAKEIRNYNAKRGIKSVIPVNPRNKKSPKAGRPKKFDQDVYRERSAVERFNSWIEANKKVSVRYEHLEISYIGLVLLACSIMIWRLLG